MPVQASKMEATIAVLQYQLGHLTEITTKGFLGVEAAISGLTRRLDSVERWQADRDVAARESDRRNEKNHLVLQKRHMVYLTVIYTASLAASIITILLQAHSL